MAFELRSGKRVGEEGKVPASLAVTTFRAVGESLGLAGAALAQFVLDSVRIEEGREVSRQEREAEREERRRKEERERQEREREREDRRQKEEAERREREAERQQREAEREERRQKEEAERREREAEREERRQREEAERRERERLWEAWQDSSSNAQTVTFDNNLNLTTEDLLPCFLTEADLTFYASSGDGYCMPVYVRCNDVYDCPGKKDEAACDSYTCPGKGFPGQDYAFGVMIVLNFVLFMLIAVGQILIYWSIQTNSMSDVDPARRSRDLAIARRLFAIVMSDFICWFPVGLTGIMAALGTSISGEVNVAMAIFTLPFNSALNPFLYTFNVIMEKRRVKQEELLRQRLMVEIKRNLVKGSAPEN
nr:hypothetical protein BaRGS_008550 [Batillaria attramentaria]